MFWVAIQLRAFADSPRLPGKQLLTALNLVRAPQQLGDPGQV